MIDLIVRENFLNETFFSIINCMQKDMIFSLCSSNFLPHNKMSIRRDEILRTLFIKRKSFNVHIVSNKWFWKHWNIFKFNKYTVILYALIFATVDEIGIIQCISNIETINFHLNITIINIDSKIDIGHYLILHTTKSTQENDHKNIEYLWDHTSLPRVAEKQFQNIIESVRKWDDINSRNL